MLAVCRERSSLPVLLSLAGVLMAVFVSRGVLEVEGAVHTADPHVLEPVMHRA
jgi:hypothetical protein